jgi:Flp pilus assembly protein TadD
VGDQPAAGSAGVMNVADAAIAGGDPGMALKVSQSVLANDPTNLNALYHEAAAYYAVNRCMDAIAAYKVALTLQPNSSAAQLGIGRCLLKHNAAEAELAFAAAVADDPRNAAALNDLGIARDLQGHHQAAVAPYQQSLLIDPGNVATEVNLGMSLALAGDGPGALEYLGPLATGQGATPKIREDYAMALVASGRPDEAQRVLSADLAPDAAQALVSAFSTAMVQAQQPAQMQAQAAAEVAAANAPASVAPVATIPAVAAPVQAMAMAPVAPVSPNVQAANAPAPVVITPASPASMPPATISIATMAHDDAALGDQVVR